MTGYEEQILARAEMLEETDGLVQSITAILAGAQGAGVDPAAVTSLAVAARALDPGAVAGYHAGSKEDRRPGSGYRSDGEFVEAVSQAEDDARERLLEVQQLQEQVMAALDAAQAALEAAYAMPVKDECDGCHGAREAWFCSPKRSGASGCATPPPRSWNRSPRDSRPHSVGCARSRRNSARSTNWSTRSSAGAASCPPAHGG
jgi:hypothetical protein